jgi:hypothetical protein
MATTSDDLLKIARRCADRLTLSKRRLLPALEDIEEQCEGEIEELLSVLQDEDVFGDVDLGEQQKVADQIEAALPENRRELVAQLTDQHTRHVWLQQEAAYHLGLAVGMKLAAGKTAAELEELVRPEREDEDEDWDGREPDDND